MLGVASFGVLEFANSMLAWFLLLADGGLELWATREVARTTDVPGLVARVVPLRFLLATASFVLLFLLLPAMPGNGQLRVVLALFGLSLFAQAASLKWLFLGREQMGRVGTALVVSQLAFALGVFAFIRRADHLLWVPVIKLVADLFLAAGFARWYGLEHGSLWLPYTFSGARMALGPAMTLGISQAMGLLNFNFNTIFIGFFRGLLDVGLFNAAYKPVTMVLAVPLTYFAGLFPTLARAWHDGPESLRPIAERSLRLCVMAALPAGVGVSLLARPIVEFLFGPGYADSAIPLAILAWSAVFVILRGTYRHGLNAAGLQNVDLRCAVLSSAANVGLNILLIPRYGLLGAACATVAGDVLWFSMSAAYFQSRVLPLSFLRAAWRPALAAAGMGGCLSFAPIESWVLRLAAAGMVYCGVLVLCGEPWRTLGRRA
jgi:O-antigen/teichoic acid export membrane protein